MQASSGVIKKVSVDFDKDPHAPANAKASALLTFNIDKRGQHVFAEQFSFFQDPNEFKIGYQVERYPSRLASMGLLNTTTFGTVYR